MEQQKLLAKIAELEKIIQDKDKKIDELEQLRMKASDNNIKHKNKLHKEIDELGWKIDELEEANIKLQNENNELKKIINNKYTEINELKVQNKPKTDKPKEDKKIIIVEDNETESESEIEDSEEKPKYYCHVCDKSYFDKSSLNKHMKSDKHKKIENGEEKHKVHKCQHCQYSTKISTNFKKHLKTHKDIKSFDDLKLLLTVSYNNMEKFKNNVFSNKYNEHKELYEKRLKDMIRYLELEIPKTTDELIKDKYSKFLNKSKQLLQNIP
jgi:hypothetical protein